MAATMPAPVPAATSTFAAGAQAAAGAAAAPPVADGATASFQSLFLPTTIPAVEVPAAAPLAAIASDEATDEISEAAVDADFDEQSPQGLAVDLFLQWLRPAPLTAAVDPVSVDAAPAPPLADSPPPVPPMAPVIPAEPMPAPVRPAVAEGMPPAVAESAVEPFIAAGVPLRRAPLAAVAPDEATDQRSEAAVDADFDETPPQGLAAHLLMQRPRPVPAPLTTAVSRVLIDAAPAPPLADAPPPPVATMAAVIPAEPMPAPVPPAVAERMQPVVAEPTVEPSNAAGAPLPTVAEAAALPDFASPVVSTAPPAPTVAPLLTAPAPIDASPRAADAAVPVASGAPQTLHTEQPDWPLALGDSITWALDRQQPEALIELHPAELGSLVVRIETRGADAQVTIVAATAAARDLLQQSLPQLRELLMVQGLNLSRAQIDRPAVAGQGGQSDLQSFRERGAGAGGRRRVGRLLLVDAYA